VEFGKYNASALYKEKKRNRIMGIFDKFKNNDVDIEKLSSEKSEKQYFDQCKFIWKNYVPQSGQATILQGELLREIEKLRYEAQDNGNINWDDDFAYFCDFLKETLLKQSIYTKDTKTKITLALDHFKECGEYARKFSDGENSDDHVDMNKVAYVDDNLYDIISDAIGLFQKLHPEPIPFKQKESVKR